MTATEKLKSLKELCLSNGWNLWALTEEGSRDTYKVDLGLKMYKKFLMDLDNVIGHEYYIISCMGDHLYAEIHELYDDEVDEVDDIFGEYLEGFKQMPDGRYGATDWVDVFISVETWPVGERPNKFKYTQFILANEEQAELYKKIL